MFGPNVKADERGLYYHHRETSFHVLLQALEVMFTEHFGLDEYEFLFLTGSGTTANETIIFSFRYGFDFLHTDAEFGLRLQRMSDTHKKDVLCERRFVAYPLYETSISRLNIHSENSDALTFLDMVSAFPYYMPPKGTSIWTTVSSKQLGAYPVLGIIGIHRELDLGEFVTQKRGSSLNLLDHLHHRQFHETLTTPSIPLYYDLLQRLRTFDVRALRKKIERRRKKIVSIVGIENTMGCGPVITFKHLEKLESLAKQFNLYKSERGYQVFLWSGKDDEYKLFYKELERVIK
jgi:aspartate aminotransferase-like enzyme